MTTSEPLWDLSGRTLTLHPDTLMVIDRLLRLQNSADHERPIILYVVGVSSGHRPNAAETLLLASVMRSLNSDVHTVGMGLLDSHQTLLVAAGSSGHGGSSEPSGGNGGTTTGGIAKTQDNGCNCSIGGQSKLPAFLFPALAGLAMLLMRRRRR